MNAKPIPLLLTRPQAASQQVVRDLAARGVGGFAPVFSPAMQIRHAGALPETQGLAGLIFTSANGARAWAALGGRTDLPAWTVGEATAQAARDAGMTARAMGRDADSLVQALAAQAVPAPLLHVRGEHSRGDVAGRLSAVGLPCTAFTAYRQPELPPNPQALAMLAGESPVVAPLYSPRSALIVSNWPGKAPLLVAAISQAVVNACESPHIVEVKVAARPDSASMLDCIADLLTRAPDFAARRGQV